MVLFYTAIVTLGTILFTLLLTAPHSTAAAVIQAQQDQTVTQKEKCDNSATTRGCCEIMQTRYQSLPFYLDGQDSNFVCRVESSGNEYPGLVKKAWTGFHICCDDLERDANQQEGENNSNGDDESIQ